MKRPPPACPASRGRPRCRRASTPAGPKPCPPAPGAGCARRRPRHERQRVIGGGRHPTAAVGIGERCAGERGRHRRQADRTRRQRCLGVRGAGAGNLDQAAVRGRPDGGAAPAEQACGTGPGVDVPQPGPGPLAAGGRRGEVAAGDDQPAAVRPPVERRR